MAVTAFVPRVTWLGTRAFEAELLCVGTTPFLQAGASSAKQPGFTDCPVRASLGEAGVHLASFRGELQWHQNPEPGSRAPLPVMSVPVRAGPSSWRRAATLVLAAGWTRPVPAAASRPQPPAEGFRVLLLQRSASQGFLPGAQVFPGGVLEAADRSTDWLRLFAPHHGPPRFGLGRAPPQRAAFPVLPNVRPGAVDEDAAALPDDIAFRICAIRETFEEAGVLLLRPRDPRPPNQAPGCALAPPPALADWRARVRRDPRHFLSLCAQLDCTPDIWALHDWSVWITPFSRPGGRRFETTFFLCCLNEPPPVFPDLVEVVDCQVGRPPGPEWGSTGARK